MSDSQSSTEIFTVRIVSIDYYMAPPIPDADICYSSFHGTNPALSFFHFPRTIEFCPRTIDNNLGFIPRFKVSSSHCALVCVSLFRFVLLRWKGERGACDKSVWFYSCWPENLLAHASSKITREISLSFKPYSVRNYALLIASYLLPFFPH